LGFGFRLFGIYKMALIGLLLRLKNHKALFSLALFLLVISSLIEIAIPQIVRFTIDHYVLPRYAVDRKTGDFVDITKIPKWELESRVGKERYYKTPLGYILSDSLLALPKEKILKYREEDIRGIRVMFALFLLLLAVKFFANLGFSYYGNKVSQLISHELRMETFQHALKLPAQYYDKTPLGVVLTRLTGDVSAVAQAYSEGFLVILKDILLFFLALSVMLSINIKLTFLVLLLVPLVLLFSYVFSIIINRAWREVRNLIANLNAFVQENIWGLRLIQNLGIYKEMFGRFSKINRNLYSAYMKVAYIFGIFMPLISLMSYVGIAIIIWYSAGGILRNEISFGSLVAFLSYVDLLFQPIREFGERIQNIQSSVAGYEKVISFLSENEENYNGKGGKLGDVAIRFENVTFSYDGENFTLRDINLEIRSGEKVALVGKTGSGKTTMLNLMMGFYTPNYGKVEVFGLDTREWDKRLLRSLFSPVIQELTVFADSIENNITFGYDLEYKGIFEKLGFSYLLEKEYNQLSTGEKQIIAVLRALTFNRPIVIFDEATSNLDAITELKIKKILLEEFSGKTLIIVAHRLATATLADKIVVLQKGRIVEVGSHRELMEKGGIYYRLYSLQNL